MTTEERLDKLERELTFVRFQKLENDLMRAQHQIRWLVFALVMIVSGFGLIWLGKKDFLSFVSFVVVLILFLGFIAIVISALVDDGSTQRKNIKLRQELNTKIVFRANAFVVEDENGKERISLGMFGNNPSLSLYDENGKAIWSTPTTATSQE